jgi:Holliday junction resolvasome RuvABC endonuclease subunit
MNILSLDLGTTTGWAIRREGKLRAGSVLLATERQLKEQRKLRGDRRGDARIQALWEFIEDMDEAAPFDAIVFEDVQFVRSTAQAHLWASFRTTIWLYAYLQGKTVECLATGKLKVWATGCGSATKEMMAAWLVHYHPEIARFYDGHLRFVENNAILDDNATDALHLLLWAEKTLKNEPPSK